MPQEFMIERNRTTCRPQRNLALDFCFGGHGNIQLLGLSFRVHAIYAALGNRKFDLRPKWKLRVTTIYIRKYGLGFSPLFLNGS